MSEVITNGLVVTLSNSGSPVTSGATSITVTYTSGGTGVIPSVSGQVMRFNWEGEIIELTTNSGTGNVNWTIVRGVESTTAASHADATLLYQVVTVGSLQQYIADQIIANIAAGTGISVGVSSNTVTVSVGSQPYDVVCSLPGLPGVGAVILLLTFTRTVVFPGNFSGSAGTVGTNPTSTATYTVKKNGSSIGTVVVSTGGSVTFTTTSGATETFNSGDRMVITAPSPQDATLADVAVTLTGTR